LRAFIGAMVRERQDREDIFQEAVLTLWDNFAQYDPGRPFGAWARGIAMNKVRRYWQRAGRVPTPFSPEAILAILDAFERWETGRPVALEALEQCLEPLPPKSRRLLELRYKESLSVDEIAPVVGAAAAGVYKALSRLRARLQACIEHRLPRLTER
jgi:RNA polymerase sigma-70 factor, ECF subfamily